MHLVHITESVLPLLASEKLLSTYRVAELVAVFVEMCSSLVISALFCGSLDSLCQNQSPLLEHVVESDIFVALPTSMIYNSPRRLLFSHRPIIYVPIFGQTGANYLSVT